jgi:ADP-ribose pyrophosphatase YjhB (NUDIX family)
MSRDYPQGPIVGVLAIVRRDGRFLLVRRGREPNKGRWGFPGGVQELGETVFAAGLRELAEETGVAAANPRLLDIADVIDHDEAGAVRHHYTLISVLLDWVSGDGVAGDDAAALGWFRPADLADLSILPRVPDLMAAADAAARPAPPDQIVSR